MPIEQLALAPKEASSCLTRSGITCMLPTGSDANRRGPMRDLLLCSSELLVRDRQSRFPVITGPNERRLLMVDSVQDQGWSLLNRWLLLL